MNPKSQPANASRIKGHFPNVQISMHHIMYSIYVLKYHYMTCAYYAYFLPAHRKDELYPYISEVLF